jgi:hypothetical protein
MPDNGHRTHKPAGTEKARRIEMKMLTVLAAFFALVSGVCYADESDDTLRFFLSKADLIVLGTVTSEPTERVEEEGVPSYLCEFTVSDVCKGDITLRSKTVKVSIKRFERDKKDHHPLIKKDAECILFLKKAPERTTPQWVTADFWLGVQYPSPWMVKSIKRLAKQGNSLKGEKQ